MTWVLIFCAWGYKAGGCTTPTQYPSQRACEFVLQRQTALAKESGYGANYAAGRCLGVRP